MENIGCQFKKHFENDVIGMVIPLQLVEVIAQVGQGILKTLAFSGVHDDRVRLARGLHWVSGHDLPVVKHALREGLAAGVGAEIGSEA
jgi:hypothetical protein